MSSMIIIVWNNHNWSIFLSYYSSRNIFIFINIIILTSIFTFYLCKHDKLPYWNNIGEFKWNCRLPDNVTSIWLDMLSMNNRHAFVLHFFIEMLLYEQDIEWLSKLIQYSGIFFKIKIESNCIQNEVLYLH